MAVTPRKPRTPPPCRLVPFDPIWAERIVNWVDSPQEMYWLAPKTRPPLTVREVLRWRNPDHGPYMLLPDTGDVPVAYGELNRLSGARRQYWLGHLVVDPAWRGQGYGLELTRRLLEEAFERRGAQRVTLVVFPENERALACYRSAGMREDGYEWHDFPIYGQRVCLIRLAASRLF